MVSKGFNGDFAGVPEGFHEVLESLEVLQNVSGRFRQFEAIQNLSEKLMENPRGFYSGFMVF